MCDCPYARHYHGHPRTYAEHGCRCDRCLSAHRARRAAAKLSPRVDIEPVREHVRLLLDAGGHTVYTIADAAGVSVRSVLAASSGVGDRGPQQSMSQAVAEALLAVLPRRVPASDRLVPALATRRRLQGLAAMGVPVSRLEPMTGLRTPDLYRISGGHVEQVHASTEARVASVADQLLPRLRRAAEPVDKVARRTRTKAQQRGWVPLSAWRSIDLHNPNALPMDHNERGRR